MEFLENQDAIRLGGARQTMLLLSNAQQVITSPEHTAARLIMGCEFPRASIKTPDTHTRGLQSLLSNRRVPLPAAIRLTSWLVIAV
jgi:hypothetical protein